MRKAPQEKSSRARLRVGVILITIVAAYVVGYGAARDTHRLVRYESGCVLRGGLEGHARDLWKWPFRCSELRRYLASSNAWEVVFAALIAVEEAGREPRRERPSICTLERDPLGFPSQGITRPEWCGP